MEIILKHIVVVGGGPSGCMAAISCKRNNPDYKVTLVEGNDRLGVKLRLTGGGRCNLTANVPSDEIIRHTPRNGRFLYSSLSQFSTYDIMDYFTKRGLALKEEDHHRIFPVTNKADDVAKVLEKELNELGVQIKFNTRVTRIDAKRKQLITNKNEIAFDHLILAMGGSTYPETGSDRLGFELIESLGHTVTELKPAEVPLVSNASIIQSKELQGLSFKDVSITSFIDDKKIIQVKHDLLFTHFGLSGPGALQTSSYLTNAFTGEHKVHLLIDFLPDIRLEDLQTQSKDAEILLQSYGIPKRLINVLKEQFPTLDLYTLIKKFPLELHGTRGFTTAFVTSGGVNLKEIDPKTLRSKIHPWLSICGESLDVNSLTGGYNMTVAFSTGYTAGLNIDN